MSKTHFIGYNIIKDVLRLILHCHFYTHTKKQGRSNYACADDRPGGI